MGAPFLRFLQDRANDRFYFPASRSSGEGGVAHEQLDGERESNGNEFSNAQRNSMDSFTKAKV
jgi:hypothetical protein